MCRIEYAVRWGEPGRVERGLPFVASPGVQIQVVAAVVRVDERRARDSAVSGCLAVGFVIAALVDRHRSPQWLRVALVMGFCGGFTTFSTFAQETLDLIVEGDNRTALATIGANVILGLVAVYVGARLGRLV